MIPGVWVLLFFGCMDFDYSSELIGVFDSEEKANAEATRRYDSDIDPPDVYEKVKYKVEWWPLNFPVNQRGDGPFDRSVLEAVMVEEKT
jgi:hypothetical protein